MALENLMQIPCGAVGAASRGGQRPAGAGKHKNIRNKQYMSMIQEPQGLEVRGPIDAEQSEILSPGALEFFCALQRQFNPSRLNLLRLRQQRQEAIGRGEPPGFLPETQ